MQASFSQDFLNSCGIQNRPMRPIHSSTQRVTALTGSPHPEDALRGLRTDLTL